MRDISQSLIAEEFRGDNASDTEGHAAFRVCEKLRRPMSSLTGIIGYRSLSSRALTLAKAKEPSLGRILIKPDGAYEFPAESETQLEKDALAAGGPVLVAQLIGLLVTFIGEALTQRLVNDIWPKATLKNSDSTRGKP